MKTLIVYYSFTKNNEKLAHLIERKLSCDVLRVEELRKRSGLTILLDVLFNRYGSIKTSVCTLSNYDHVIFISPVWAGRIASPLKTFIRSEKAGIPEYSFITICGGVAGQAFKIEKQLTSLAGKPPKKLVELWVNDLLSASEKNKIKNTTGHRVDDKDLIFFQPKIQEFLAGL